MKRIVFFTVVISMLTAFSGVMLQAQDTGNTRRTPQMSRGAIVTGKTGTRVVCPNLLYVHSILTSN